ncbi:MAG: restriction endonuclease subunit S, partial [Bacteroidia bacterium]|nr:restriction endonuclease subunit S [Bacteroidia bacterium]
GHASMKRVHYQEGKFALGNILCAVIPNDEKQLHPKYLHLYLQQFKDSLLVPLMKGAANVSLPMNKLADVEIEVPSLERQLEIIELEEEAAEYKNELEERLIAQDGDVAKLRQAFLREAMQGKLTKQDEKDGSAKDLLEKIISKTNKELTAITYDEIPFEIPNSWQWCKIGDIAQHNAGKTLDSGRNSGQHRKYITTSNLYWRYFELDNLKSMPIEENELNKCTATKGDLLVCEGGEAGRAAIWKSDSEICFQNHIHRIRPFEKISSEFIYWNFLYLNLSGRINLYRKGMGISNISGKSLASIPIPLPPLAEQNRIVKKLEQLMQFCDELQYSIRQSKIENEKLLQGALRDALKIGVINN